ncbi:MAG: RagB/SusD family nutrient uptake outer membrane protein [Prevotella sp.]|jgi:hypothetical protein|nr:RagB/SusD family nutrient uptake outer membrane protein [Prevotella sp.]MCH3986252.1 RagB/SusD family nutrient uptake outer membrane protein [Prevotella sp.]MCH3992896.1 RagB/SusD family nutrient uptake outer membrane protein [Prevotella sp.]MCH4018915.1 RagB/SusD family nutrient uptake outer membrane protein [Prevotella sp.]MCH4099476.1 RagB/SusD family nutrient uptake outer membrane protein [Prevotella sp.]
MKLKLSYIIMFLGLIFGITSCDLDPKVYSEMTEQNFPETIDDANQLLTGLYANLKNNSGGLNDSGANGGWGWPVYTINENGWYGFNEITTDEAYYVEGTEMRDFTWGSAFDTMNTYRLGRNIARATNLIDVLNKLSMDDATKNRMIAETKCIRADIMYALYSLYGPVPMVIDPADVQKGGYVARPSKEEYFNQMVKDLTEAIPYLYEKTQGTANWGRVNKGLANMLLMKLYMNDHQYDKALPYAEALTKMGYKLSEDYFDAFKNEQSDEIIWAVPSGTISDNEWFYYAIPSDCNQVCGQEVAPYWGVFTMPWAFYNTFTDQDVRKMGIGATYKEYRKNAQTNQIDTILHSRYSDPGQRLQYGPLVVKYFLDKDKTSTGRIYQVCYRYSDVLLCLAEIENNLHGPTDKALGYLKQITDRAGTTSTIPVDIQASKEKFNEFLLAERGRELYFEGWRREDLIRFGKFISNAIARGKKDAKDYMTVLPIPPSVITQSGGIVKQNAGYE